MNSCNRLYALTEVVDVFCKKVLLDILQSSQENTRVRVSILIQLQASGLWHRYFPVNLAKFLRIPFLTEHLRWLLLHFKGCLSTCLGCHFCFASYKSNFVTF